MPASPPARASSAPTPVVWLREQPCAQPRYASSALLPLLRLELAGLGVRLEPWPEGDEPSQVAAVAEGLALITVACADAADAVELTVDDLATRTHSARTLALDDVGAGAAERALALAIASSLESSLSASALAPSAGAVPSVELPSAVRDALRARMRARLALPPVRASSAPLARPSAYAPGPVELSAISRLFPGHSTGLLGVQGGAALPLGGALVLDLDGEALAGQSELSDAEGTVGKMWLYWLSAGAGISLRSHDRPQLSLGPRVRAGYAFADAHTERAGASARDDSGPLFALLACASLRAPISRNASLLFAIDFGYTLVGIVFVGDQARLSGMAGVTAGLRAGVSF